jgi:hypothetical protein
MMARSFKMRTALKVKIPSRPSIRIDSTTPPHLCVSVCIRGSTVDDMDPIRAGDREALRSKQRNRRYTQMHTDNIVAYPARQNRGITFFPVKASDQPAPGSRCPRALISAGSG